MVMMYTGWKKDANWFLEGLLYHMKRGFLDIRMQMYYYMQLWMHFLVLRHLVI